MTTTPPRPVLGLNARGHERVLGCVCVPGDGICIYCEPAMFTKAMRDWEIRAQLKAMRPRE